LDTEHGKKGVLSIEEGLMLKEREASGSMDRAGLSLPALINWI